MRLSRPPRFSLPLLARAAALPVLLGCGLLASVAPAAAAPALRWSSPQEIDAGHALQAISCPSSALCVAVDNAGRALLGTHPLSGAAGAWSAALNVDGGRTLTSISCPTVALCVAVDGEGHALVSTAPSAPGSWAALDIDGATALTSVSCPSSALCVAVDAAGNRLVSTSPGIATPAAWSAPAAIASALAAVSCTPTACVAVDGQGRALLSSEPRGGAANWHARTIDPSLGLNALSCFAGSACVALDGASDAFATVDAAASLDPGAGPGSGATWTATGFDPFGAPDAISCANTGLCVAGDAAGYVLASDNPAGVPPSWPATPLSPHALTGVACTSEGFCAAVDSAGRAFTAQAPAPTATSAPAQEVAHTSAILAGFANPNDAAVTVCRFEYGTTSAYEATAPCASTPAGSAAAPVGAFLSGLTPGSTYHYRLVLATALGVAEGADQSFTALAPNVVEPHPSIGGTPAPGQRLSCKAGVATTTGVTLAYAWLRDTRATGAGGAGYTVSSADVSHHLQCRVSATTSEGTRTATSAFVTVPAGGLGTIAETLVGAPRVGRGSVSVPLTCSPQAAGSCTLELGLTVVETLRGKRVVAVAAATTRHRTVSVAARTVHLKPAQRYTALLALNATGRALLAHRRRLPVRLSVSGTVVGALSASLKSATLTLTASGKAAARRSGARGAGVRRAHARAVASGLLAATPYMGWDSYFTFGVHFDEATVLAQASQLVTRGLARRGYRYVWLDVGWWHGARSPAGEMVVDPTQWPHGIAWLASTLHAAGLKLGLYTDAGAAGCGGPSQGSYGHYQQDVNTFAKWGVDAVKVDYCGGIRQGLEPAAAYGAFHEAILHDSPHRPLLLAICNFLQPGQFASEDPSFQNSNFASYSFGPTSGNSWRTDTDIGVPGDIQFGSVLRNLDADAAQPQAAGPGHWNDPDYLAPDQGMSGAQFRTQLSMWAMLAAPLMVSADLISLSSTSAGTLANRQAIAIDQDPAGQQARLLAASGEAQVWVKPLADGSRAVALLNRGGSTTTIATSASAIGMAPASAYTVRNVWSASVTSVGAPGTIQASVPASSTVLVRVSAR
jgi:hypothetical protein